MFNKVKKRIAKELVLALYNLRKEYIVYIDASNKALGATLIQPNNKGQMHLVAYLSKKFTLIEKNYNIHDKELYAIVEACREWRAYLHGNNSQFKSSPITRTSHGSSPQKNSIDDSHDGGRNLPPTTSL